MRQVYFFSVQTMVSSDGVAENWDVVIGLKMLSCYGPTVSSTGGGPRPSLYASV